LDILPLQNINNKMFILQLEYTNSTNKAIVNFEQAVPVRVFSGIFRAVKRPQKLNLELSFETQSSHQSFSAVKMKLFELNL
jgi:hypothetical protein